MNSIPKTMGAQAAPDRPTRPFAEPTAVRQQGKTFKKLKPSDIRNGVLKQIRAKARGESGDD